MVAKRRSSYFASKVAPIPGASQAEVLNELRRVILAGEVPPGAPIAVGEVAERFAVSPIPVRESLMTLIGEGLVDHRPRGGYAVAQLTLAELREVYVVRRVLEAAALAAAVGLAGPRDDARATEALTALEQAVTDDDSAAYHRESRRFHMALLAPSGMQRLRYVLESAWNVTEPCRPMAYIGVEERSALHADHHAMLAAFVARDADDLLDLSAKHHHRLESSIADLPPETGLFAAP
ncbi:GntR family transcriptional regulator [Cryptosporangium phraense]|uniref:GntR family transcriptional regulator n=1 Tax=Cryptosporangium phraense TaxID=2593070 RepID=A0A545AMU9_9ACTN|nr:GntR family transcriptional regulator [Cryptosporangium phraense]TQS42659.1 GntR family transcriptional regulator [Cryptosporangium phraense]